MNKRRSTVIPGLFLILLGIWFLLTNLGIELFSFEKLWPLLIILGGTAFLISWITAPAHDPGLAFAGTAAVLTGAFFLGFTWGVWEWAEMERLWPAFPTIGGFAFLVLWAAGRFREWGLLIPALGGLAVGGVAFLLTFQLLPPDLGPTLLKLWPLLLVLMGVVILAQTLLGRGRR